MVVDVVGLVKSFGRTHVLRELDLSVARGEVHGFLEPNGAGKTTTLRILLGLLRADAGVAAAACARIPAAWVVVGMVMVVWGGELGPVWGLPRAVIDLSPFAHSPLLPGTDVDLASLGWLTALAAVLVASGISAFRRRDVTP